MTQVSVTAEYLLAGESLNRHLEQLTQAFLDRMPCLTAEDIGEFVALRQNLVSSLQEIDTSLATALLQDDVNGDSELVHSIRVYKKCRRDVMERVLALDARIVADAGMVLQSVQKNIEAVAQGKHAIRGYGDHGESVTGNLHRTA